MGLLLFIESNCWRERIVVRRSSTVPEVIVSVRCGPAHRKLSQHNRTSVPRNVLDEEEVKEENEFTKEICAN